MLNGFGFSRAALLIAVVPSLAVACSASPEALPSNEKSRHGAYALGDCGGLDYAGECDGATLRWCESGTLMEVNCASSGRSCSWQDNAVGNNCVAGGAESGGACGSVDYNGYCDGDTLVWCEDGLQKVDCAADGRTCAWQGGGVGNNCVGGSSGGGVGNGSTLGFGYPVGDTSTYPAGGWDVSQVLGNWLNGAVFHGGHLAEDIYNPYGETANAPVYSMADGTVLYAGTNHTSYKHVVLIEHILGNGERICSFYGHLWAPDVYSGQKVSRGQQIAQVMDWAYYYPGEYNSHLHYVLVNSDVCDTAYYGSGGVCGYDYTSWSNGIYDLATEPAEYTSIGDPCGTEAFAGGYIAPSQFVVEHHF